jgi:hypothetical protein
VTAVEPSATGGMHGFPAALTSFAYKLGATGKLPDTVGS